MPTPFHRFLPHPRVTFQNQEPSNNFFCQPQVSRDKPLFGLMNHMSEHSGSAGNAASLNSNTKWINFQSGSTSQSGYVLDFGSKQTKRKQIDFDRGKCDPQNSKRSRSGAVSIVLADEDCSVNHDLNFQHELDTENAGTKPALNLELSLSVGPAVSAITSEASIKSAKGKTGGGRRCREDGCATGARGKCGLCIKHGGGNRCKRESCTKGAAGGTCFCIAHGGGNRCTNKDCAKSVQGGTKHCIGHGGGYRCQFEGCGKSAQGRTNFCRAHGDSQMCSICSWMGSDETSSSRRASTGWVGLCAPHSALVQDRRVHGAEIMGTSAGKKPAAPEKMKMTAVGEFCLSGWKTQETSMLIQPIIPVRLGTVSVLEGKVHGGNLMGSWLAQEDDPLSQPDSQAEGQNTNGL